MHSHHIDNDSIDSDVTHRTMFALVSRLICYLINFVGYASNIHNGIYLRIVVLANCKLSAKRCITHSEHFIRVQVLHLLINCEWENNRRLNL